MNIIHSNGSTWVDVESYQALIQRYSELEEKCEAMEKVVEAAKIARDDSSPATLMENLYLLNDALDALEALESLSNTDKGAVE